VGRTDRRWASVANGLSSSQAFAMTHAMAVMPGGLFLLGPFGAYSVATRSRIHPPPFGKRGLVAQVSISPTTGLYSLNVVVTRASNAKVTPLCNTLQVSI
jgi:hypothetical protein